MEQKALTGLNVLVTRPAHQAYTLCQLIKKQGGRTIAVPTLEIEFLMEDPSFKCLSTFPSKGIFLSANAVPAGAKVWSGFTNKPQLIAIGQGTAMMLKKHGLQTDVIPLQSSSEGLLELPELQSLQGETIVIFKGIGGRTVLSDSLRKRGALVQEAICYKRECPKTKVEVQQLLAANAVVVTSNEALSNLFKIIPDKKWLSSLRFILMSERAAIYAESLGINDYSVVPYANDEGIIVALTRGR